MPTNPPARPQRRTGVAAARRGVSLLETLFAAAALGLATVVVASTLGFVYARQHRERVQLACAELGNRLALMYLDDPSATLALPQLVAYDGLLMRWSLDESVVEVRENSTVSAARSRQSRNELSKRLLVYTITVWLSEESGGTQFPTPATPSHALTRLYDPISSQRNFDTVQRQLNRGQMSEWTREIIGTNRTTRSRAGTQASLNQGTQ
ncbi:MAG: hypothetical protein KF866_10135 [Phycisphaeraceae bacterium]|nr:hypothetical protein [Phycisphaeraceae bacterium]